MRQQSESMFLQTELISRQSAGMSGGPRLRVTRIRVTEGDLLKAGSPISGILEIENIGGYGAEIERHCAFCVWGWPTLKPPWDYTTTGIPSVTANRIGLARRILRRFDFLRSTVIHLPTCSKAKATGKLFMLLDTFGGSTRTTVRLAALTFVGNGIVNAIASFALVTQITKARISAAPSL